MLAARKAFRRAAAASLALFALFVLAPAAYPQSAKATKEVEKPRPAKIDRNGVLILVRSTLLALDQANKTGNYSVLRDLGAPDFQASNPARLAEIFANQRKQGLDLSGVAAIEPQLTLQPQIEPDGKLRIAGLFPSAPLQLNFEILFAPVDRQWKLSGMSVKLGSSTPSAPAAAPAPASKPSKVEPKAPAAAISASPSSAEQ